MSTGLEITDWESDAGLTGRPLRARHLSTPIDGITRLARTFMEAPEYILQELVQAAIDLCGADSAGVSLEIKGGTETHFYEWVATAGRYTKLLHAMLPRVPSACGVCLERGRPQRFRAAKRLFDSMDFPAREATDGFLLPIVVGDRRGTVFVVAHGREEAFDQDDLRIMRMLTDMVELGMRQGGSTEAATTRPARPDGVRDRSSLARKFDNSLQGMKVAIYLGEHLEATNEARLISEAMANNLDELSTMVRELLRLPLVSRRPN